VFLSSLTTIALWDESISVLKKVLKICSIHSVWAQGEHNETLVVLNSNLMIPDLAFLNWESQQGRDFAMPGSNKKISIGPILFLGYEESLVSSNLNSKQLRFHGVRSTKSYTSGKNDVLLNT